MKEAGRYDSSGYFLIEDVFCNDIRDPSAVDYSKTILDWLKNSTDEALKKWEYIIAGELQEKQKAFLGSKINKQQLPGSNLFTCKLLDSVTLDFVLVLGIFTVIRGTADPQS